MICPNTSHPVWKEMVEALGVNRAYFVFDKNEGYIDDERFVELLKTNNRSQAYVLRANELISPNNDDNQPKTEKLFGLDIQNQEQLEFHINTLNVIGQFLENIGVEQRLVPEFLSQEGNVVKGAIAAANFIEGTVDIIDDFEKRPSAWNKLPEEAAHFWYRLLDINSPLKSALYTAHQTALKNDELYKSKYGELVSTPADLSEESIGQLIAEAIKRVETKNGSPSDYSFLKKFIEWINNIIKAFKKTKQDPFEIAAMKILYSDMSDLMTWEEYKKLNNIVNFADLITEQSILDYSKLENVFITETEEGVRLYGAHDSPLFDNEKDLKEWIENSKSRITEIKDNQQFFDRLLNKSFRKKSKFLPKTLRKYFQILDAQNLSPLNEWNVSQELQQITKKLSEQEKRQIIETNGYTNIAPTLKVLPDILQKYKKNPIVLSETIKLDGAKKQELSILNGIKDMIKLENPNLKSITAEEFVAEAHNWLETNYLLGFANENSFLSYRTDQTFKHVSDRYTNEDINITNLTEEQLQRLPFAERQRIANILGLTKQNPSVYHNKVSLRFNDMYHSDYGQPKHFDKRPSAWGNLTYFYTGKNKWKDAVLLHEIQNDNIEFLREFKHNKVDLDASLGIYLQQLNANLLDNITQIESGGKRVEKYDIFSSNPPKQHLWLSKQLGELVYLPLDQGLRILQQGLNEKIELHRAMGSSNNIENVKEEVERTYAKRRQFIDFQRRGGIKSLLTSNELMDLKELINELNTGTITSEGRYLEEENQYEPGYERTRSLKEKKQAFQNESFRIVSKINDTLKEMYGEDFPRINLYPPAKPLPKSQRRNQVVNRGTPREMRIGNASEQLNENINFLLAFSEKQVAKRLTQNIEDAKKAYVQLRNANTLYNFNVNLSKITQKQYNKLIENYKYNQDLLNSLIDNQIQKDLQKESIDISKLTDEEIIKDITGQYEEPNEIDGFGGTTFRYKNMLLTANSKTKEDAVLEIRNRHNPDDQKENQQNKYKRLKTLALEKKTELEKDYGKIEDIAKQTLELEMNYFTPLVHHLIQKHINQYGKEIPMYFSGYQITKLTQGNDRTAMIYAGKDEVNIVNKTSFTFNGNDYVDERDIPGGNNESLYKNGNTIILQEYEKAYQQATEQRTKEIKFEAAQQIGIVSKTSVGKSTEQEIEEGIKKLNEYKKQSKQNLDRVINTIMNISGSKPIETGAIYNAMSQISGIKLIWQDNIEGLQNNAGGYLVDLSNYNYNIPILYGLQNPALGAEMQQKTNNISLLPKLEDNQYQAITDSTGFLIKGIKPEHQSEYVAQISEEIVREIFSSEEGKIDGKRVLAIIEGNRLTLQEDYEEETEEIWKNHIKLYLDNWNKVSKHVEYYITQRAGISITSKKQQQVTEEEEFEDVTTDSAGWFEKRSFEEDASFRKNLKDGVSGRVKQALSFIDTGETNYMGNEKYVDYHEAFATVLDELTNEDGTPQRPSWEIMKQRLENSSVKWMSNFITIVDKSKDLQNELVPIFSQHYLNMKGVLYKQTIEEIVEEIPMPSGEIKKKPTGKFKNKFWSFILDSNFSSGVKQKLRELNTTWAIYKEDGSANIEKIDTIISKINELSKKDAPNKTNLREFFTLLGWDINDLVIEDILSSKLKNYNGSTSRNPAGYFDNGVFENLKKELLRIKAGGSNYASTFIANNANMKQFAKLVNKYQRANNNLSFGTGGLTLSAYIPNRFLVLHLRDLKANKDRILDSISKMPFNANHIAKMLQETKLAQVLDYAYVDIAAAIKKLKSRSKKKRKLNKLGKREHEVVKISNYFNGWTFKELENSIGGITKHRLARYFYPTMSDKSNMITVQNVAEDLTYEFDANGKVSVTQETVENVFQKVVLPELRRILHELEKITSTISGYEQGRFLIHLYPELNQFKGLWEKVNGEYILTQDAINLIKNFEGDSEFKQNILKEFEKILNAQIRATGKKWHSWFYNAEDNNIDFIPEQAVANFGYPLSITEAKNENLAKIAVLAADYTLNYVVHDMTVRQNFTGDPALYWKPGVDNISNISLEQLINHPQLLEAIKNSNDNYHKRLAMDNGPGLQGNRTGTVRYAFAKDIKGDSLNQDWLDTLAIKYNINFTDAQEFTTWQEHLDFVKSFGKITESQYKAIWSKLEKQEEYADRDEEIPDELKLTQEDLKGFVFQAQKPLYSGVVAEEDILRRVYVKSSTIPLLPEFTIGTRNNVLRKAMKKNKVDRLAFVSAVKVGSNTELVDITQDEIVFPESSMFDLDVENLKLQQEVPFKEGKEEIGIGSQIAKLIFSDIISLEEFQTSFGTFNGAELYKQYTDRLETIFKEDLKGLLEEVTVNGKVDNEKLKDILQKEAIERNYSITDLQALQLTDGEFTLPLWTQTKRIQALMLSIVDNRVRKIMFPGFSSPLATEKGIEITTDLGKHQNSIIWTDKYKGGGLRSHRYDKDGFQPSQIVLPWKFRYKGKILDIKNFMTNGVVDTSKLPPDLLRIFGFRIPTQGLSSAMSFEIVGFLPYEMGDTLITSGDITQQMGSDFDIDKLYNYMYAYNVSFDEELAQKRREDFKDLYNEVTGEINEGKNADLDLLRELKALNRKIENSYKITVDNEGINKTKNELINIHHAVISHDSELIKLKVAKPLDDDMRELKKTSREIDSKIEKPSFHPLDPGHHTDKYVDGSVGKDGVGKFALDSVFMVTIQGKEIAIVDPVNITINGKSATGDYSNELTLESQQLLKSKGYDSLPAYIKAVEDVRKLKFKSDNIRAFLSSAVDHENEQILNKINVNTYTFDVVAYMTFEGFDKAETAWFLSQPIIMDYVDLMYFYKGELSEYNEAAEKEVLAQLEAKYGTYNGDKDSNLNLTTDILKERNSAYQAAILMKFLEMKKHGADIGEVQRVINTDSAGIGKDISTSVNKETKLRNLYKSPILNIGDTVGTYRLSDIQDLQEGEFYLGIERGDTVQYLYFRPNSINGLASMYALHEGNQLFKDYYPHFGQSMQRLFNELKTYVSISPSMEAEMLDNLATEYMDFYLTSLITDDMNDMRKKYIHSPALQNLIKQALEISPQNSFLRRLELEKADGAFEINFSNSTFNDFDTFDAFIHFANMFSDTRNITDKFTFRDLAEFLIKYSILVGNDPATSFRKYIPVQWYVQSGVAEQLRSLNFNNLPGTEGSKSKFLTQFLLNYSYLLPYVPGYEKNGVFTPKDKTDYMFNFIKNGNNVYFKQDGKFIKQKVRSDSNYNFNQKTEDITPTKELNNVTNPFFSKVAKVYAKHVGKLKLVYQDNPLAEYRGEIREVNGYYDGDTKVAVVNSALSKDKRDRVLVHEVTHYFFDTLARNNHPSLAKTKAVYEAFKSRQDEFLDASGEIKNELAYAVSSLEEFIAVFMSNKEVRDYLDTKLFDKNRTWTQAILDAFNEILNALGLTDLNNQQVSQIIESELLNIIEEQQSTEQPLTSSPLKVNKEAELENSVEGKKEKPSSTSTKSDNTAQELQFTKGKLNKGEEISSYSDNLAFALTNPNFTSPKGSDWKRTWKPGQAQWRNYMSKGIQTPYRDTPYKDVEEAYQQNKDKFPIGVERDNFMKELLKIKLTTYPKLIEGINSKGGLSYLIDSTHQPTKQNSHWETGGNNAFIKLLTEAYLEIITQPTQVQESVVQKPTKLFNSQDKELKKGSVVEYKGEKYLYWNTNAAGKAQLVKTNGDKFSGTPNVDKLVVLGNYPTTMYNNVEYIVTDNDNVYSGATGKLVYTGKDNSSKTQKQRIIDAAKGDSNNPTIVKSFLPKFEDEITNESDNPLIDC